MDAISLSGIEVATECIETMERVSKRTARAVIFHIRDQKLICVETTIEEAELNVHLKDTHGAAEVKTQTLLTKVVNTLKEGDSTRGRNEPRYIFTNIVCEKKGRVIDKMILIHFNPEGCGVKDKMLYACSKEALRKLATMSFVGIQITDYDDFEFEELKQEVLSKSGSV